MKRAVVKLICMILVLALLCGGAGWAAVPADAYAVSKASPLGASGEDKTPDTWELTRVSSLPENEWQKTAVFPDWKGYTDDTLAMNSMLSFQGYHGQGKIWFRVSQEVDSFTLYVNGQRWNTSEAGSGVWMADISRTAVDGVNTLQVSGT